MHYEDIKDRSIINITIYKHTTFKKNKFEYQFCAIQNCQYINPYHLKQFLKKWKKVLKPILKNIKEESFWYLSIQLDRECFNTSKKLNDKIKKDFSEFVLESREADNETERLH